MPKRSAKEKIDYYNSKIRKLENKSKERRRVIVYSSSDSEDNLDKNISTSADKVVLEGISDPGMESVAVALHTAEESQSVESKTSNKLIELDPELLSALGETEDDVPIYGESIHPNLAQRCLPILRLTKEVKDKLLVGYIIYDNYKQSRAPILNSEIMAAIGDLARARDKKIETGQQQLGLGITAVSKVIGLLLDNKDKQNKIEIVKILSDACRIPTDLHHSETQRGIKVISPGLDKSVLDVIHDVVSDEYLIGAKLADNIKASKAIEKQGLQIKKTVVTHKNPMVSTVTVSTIDTLSSFPAVEQRGAGNGAEDECTSAQRDNEPQPIEIHELQTSCANASVTQIHAGRLHCRYSCWTKITSNPVVLKWIIYT